MMDVKVRIGGLLQRIDKAKLQHAENTEKALGYYFPTGEYWLFLDQIDGSELRCLDSLWLAALGRSEANDECGPCDI